MKEIYLSDFSDPLFKSLIHYFIQTNSHYGWNVYQSMRDLIVIEIEIWIFPSNKQFFLPKADYDPVHITPNFVCFAKKPFLVRTSLFYLPKFSQLSPNFNCAIENIWRPRIFWANLRRNIIYYSQLTSLTLTIVRQTKKTNKLYYTGGDPFLVTRHKSVVPW